MLKINKIINVDNFQDPYISEKKLLKYGEGLIFVFTPNSILSRDLKTRLNRVKIALYAKCFDAVYLQIDSVEYLSDEVDVKGLDFIKHYLYELIDDIQPVLINDAYYIDKEEHEVKGYLNKVDGVALPESDDQYFKDLDDVRSKLTPLFEDNPEVFEVLLDTMIQNTNEIAEACNFTIDIGEHKLPKFELVTLNECDGDEKLRAQKLRKLKDELGVESFDSSDILMKIVLDRFNKICIDFDEDKFDEYQSRLEEELGVILPAGFADYFLILWDMIKWAKSQGIVVGNARGSVAGSLIAYLLDITTVDPIKYDLLFERFLNKTRLSGERAKSADALPDIDVDFQGLRRAEVKDYLVYKYGEDYVCSIGTYNALKPKGAIKDLARVDGLKFAYVNYITDAIDNQFKYKYRDFIQYANKRAQLYEFMQTHTHIPKLMKFVMNQTKSASVHASAVVIVPKFDKHGNPMTIYDWLPIKKMVDKNHPEGVLVSEWEGKYIDKAGFLKEDILGLSQLDKFAFMKRLIKSYYGKKIVLEKIPFNNKGVYRLYSKAITEDAFQFNSAGMARFCKMVKPDDIEDLIAMNALFRPGPMSSDAHTNFAKIKHGKMKPSFDYGLKEVTIKTHGLYIYQEQIMKATHVLGGLTLSEADEVRTVMKKFDHDKMKKFKDKFVAGAMERGCPEDDAYEIWEKLEKFSGYGFNRSHSAAYSIMSYWSMWLKHEYPLAFWVTSLQFASAGEIPYRTYEMHKYTDIETVGVDINRSEASFTGDPKTDTIYWGLTKVKGLGDKLVAKILEVRKQKKFKSLSDFIERMKGTGVGVNKALTLLLAGAFDNLHDIKKPRQRRDLVVDYYKTIGEKLDEEYTQGITKRDYYWTLWQKKLTGFGSVDFATAIAKVNKRMARIFIPFEEFESMRPSRRPKMQVVAGQVLSVYEKDSKNGKWAAIKLQSNDGVIQGCLWNETWEEFKELMKEAEKRHLLVAISGKVTLDNYKGGNVIHSTKISQIIQI